MISSKKAGNTGEWCAAQYLSQRGYHIIKQNYHSRYGEIDIIARNCQYIVFVEVKARKPDAAVSGLEAVTKQKQRRIIATALCYLEQFPTKLQPRFDVISVILKNGTGSVSHLENAFTLEESHGIF